ncbi:hypothetical protein PVAP13_5KG609307 [Panicum virgatum]|uniref:Uncharacterized protein n=1 Tax=Panicum virgatum TaxID=38727 RepID=A0A8T0SQ15_PANVG|nr:hypothetical protein PVAP13_5KG609307 [Panicum virgatum]
MEAADWFGFRSDPSKPQHNNISKGKTRRLRFGGQLRGRTAAAADRGGCGGPRRLLRVCAGRRRRPAAGTKMPRNGLARGLEVEAALAVEAAWELKVAVASMVLSP